MSDKPPVSELEIENLSSAIVIHIRGELDALLGPQLEDAVNTVLQSGVCYSIIDMTGATFIDSIGVGALIRAHRASKNMNCTTAIAGAHGMIAQLIRVTQLERIFDVFPTLDEAIAAAESTGAAGE